MTRPPPLPPSEPITPAPNDDESSTLIYAGLAWVIALFLGVGLIWVLFANNVPWADADFYFRGAKSIAEGDGYRNPFLSSHPNTAFHPVGYPWFLAHVWQVLRIDTTTCDVSAWPAFAGCGAMIQAGQIANLLLAALNIGLVFILGTLLKGPRIGLLSAVIYALIPSRLLFTASLMSEESFVTLVLAALIMLVLSVRRQDWVWYTAIGFGLAVGAAAYIRPLGIVLLPLPLVLLFSQAISPRIAFTHVAVGASLALLVLLPWTLRNHNELGGWNLVSNNGGINLWIGCHQDRNGDLASNGKWMGWWDGNAPAAINTADERANDAEAQRLALQCMREQPLAFARLSLAKGLYTFQEDWTYVTKWSLNENLPQRGATPVLSDGVSTAFGYLSNSTYLALLPLAVVGAVTVFFSPSVYRGLLGASFAVLTFVPLIFFGEPRFHVPLFPMMSIWAAEGLWVVFHGLRTASREAVERPGGLTASYEWKEEPWPR